MAENLVLTPSLEEVEAFQQTQGQQQQQGATVVPLFVDVPLAEGETPLTAFHKVKRGPFSFLWETSEGSSCVTRYSVISTEPFDVLATYDTTTTNADSSSAASSAAGCEAVDPLLPLEKQLSKFRVAAPYSLEPPLLNGGAFGYLSYDCVRYFEPVVKNQHQKDVLQIPESLFLFVSSFVMFDHSKKDKTVRLVALCSLVGDVARNYELARQRIQELFSRLSLPIDDLDQDLNCSPVMEEGVSNAGAEGYMDMVKKLKEHIVDGDVIQTVPSHRIKRRIGDLSPFAIYRKLRDFNPSHYMFYIEATSPSSSKEEDRFQLVGASPELLVKVEKGMVTTHPIAGTRKRGKTEAQDKALEEELLADEKERAEHIMLVDLGRNDINRICDPASTHLDALMVIERYSHVMHIVSHVSGRLRGHSAAEKEEERKDGTVACTPFDAFRSIFPAGTVSGAPKIRAMQLISNLEQEKRHVYAGAAGYFSFSGDIDTCIAIRTMTCKDKHAYLQAGGGIVYDSDPHFEYMESVNKMKALARAIDLVEEEAAKRVLHRKEKEEEASATQQHEENFSSSDATKQHHDSLVAVGENVEEVQLRTIEQSYSAEHRKQQRIEMILDHHKNKSKSESAKNGPKRGLTLMIDNYDSFTWNLYQYLSQLGETVVVFRNDELTVEDCKAFEHGVDRLVVSPGPGWPHNSSGVSIPVIRHFEGKIPILGVCLGHQCFLHSYSEGEVGHCGEIVHGKTSTLHHDGKGLYAGVPDDIQVIRYHSLAATQVPKDFVVTSTTLMKSLDGEGRKREVVMGIRHKRFKIEGVQFHPESIKTEYGMEMLNNFLAWTGGEWDQAEGAATTQQ
ncbi:anthranilate synthase / indole-3-glycerol phosphate synthase [Balamuthia mandrillaris]